MTDTARPPAPYGAGKYAVYVCHYPHGEGRKTLGRITLPAGTPLPRAGESVEFKGLALTVFAVLWDLDRQSDIPPGEAFDASVELRCR